VNSVAKELKKKRDGVQNVYRNTGKGVGAAKDCFMGIRTYFSLKTGKKKEGKKDSHPWQSGKTEGGKIGS